MDKHNQKNSVGFRLLLCTVILVAAVAGFIILKNMKKPPVQIRRITNGRDPVRGLVAIEHLRYDFGIRVVDDP